MAELVTCATETKLCSVCGRSQYQTTFCTYPKQAAGTFNYIQASQEERTGGPHIV
jgi:hypothetical protein